MLVPAKAGAEAEEEAEEEATDSNPRARTTKAIARVERMANETTIITSLGAEAVTTPLLVAHRKPTRKTSGTTQASMRCKTNRCSSSKLTRTDSLASSTTSKTNSRRVANKAKAKISSASSNNSSNIKGTMAEQMTTGMVVSNSNNRNSINNRRSLSSPSRARLHHSKRSKGRSHQLRLRRRMLP